MIYKIQYKYLLLSFYYLIFNVTKQYYNINYRDINYEFTFIKK